MIETIKKAVEIWKALPVFPRRTAFIFCLVVMSTFFFLQVWSIVTTGDTMGIQLKELFIGRSD